MRWGGSGRDDEELEDEDESEYSAPEDDSEDTTESRDDKYDRICIGFVLLTSWSVGRRNCGGGSGSGKCSKVSILFVWLSISKCLFNKLFVVVDVDNTTEDDEFSVEIVASVSRITTTLLNAN